MEIREYNDIDPLDVFFLNQLALDFPLTPELAAQMRDSDPRPFPCLAIYAVENEQVLGQAGIFRLPMVSTGGREDVGGIWAFSTQPQFASRGVASFLLEEAHARMRKAGLRFSTLGTDRHRAACQLYRQHGYEDTRVWGTALARWETAHQPTRLRAEPAGTEGYDSVEEIYQTVARDYLGFAWRYQPFARLRSVSLEEIWIIKENQRALGFAIVQADRTLLTIRNLALQRGLHPLEAIAAVAAEIRSSFIRVTTSRPIEINSLRHAGFHVAQPSWSSFMIKPLTPGLTVEDARSLFGIGSDRFLISWLDVT
jgi:GNAT superfamily N-acetyltransferase